jgi:hypothetical protein
MKPFYHCSDCQKKLPIVEFTIRTKEYYHKTSGKVKVYEQPNRYCKVCESVRQARCRNRREFERVYKGYQSNTAITIRTILERVKLKMRNERTPEMKFAWAHVGIELNKLLLK